MNTATPPHKVCVRARACVSVSVSVSVYVYVHVSVYVSVWLNTAFRIYPVNSGEHATQHAAVLASHPTALLRSICFVTISVCVGC
jgi:hypothetical protein